MTFDREKRFSKLFACCLSTILRREDQEEDPLPFPTKIEKNYFV
jgi:hypothetical protein